MTDFQILTTLYAIGFFCAFLIGTLPIALGWIVMLGLLCGVILVLVGHGLGVY